MTEQITVNLYRPTLGRCLNLAIGAVRIIQIDPVELSMFPGGKGVFKTIVEPVTNEVRIEAGCETIEANSMSYMLTNVELARCESVLQMRHPLDNCADNQTSGVNHDN